MWTSLAEWATDPERIYKQAAVDEFLSKADFFLIAQAMATDAAVVTMEKAEPDSKTKVKIPDACAAFGVPCIQPFEVYRISECASRLSRLNAGLHQVHGRRYASCQMRRTRRRIRRRR